MWDQAKAFTVYGESCYDECLYRGNAYTFCHKYEYSFKGQWTGTGLCTPTSGVTAFGTECADNCERRNEDYYWCHKKRLEGGGSAGWGYCTPKFLIDHLTPKQQTEFNIPK